MKLNILAFGIAKDIFESNTVTLEVSEAIDIQSLKKEIVQLYPAFEKLVSFAVAVNSEYQQDTFMLSENDEIAIIPPVSGG